MEEQESNVDIADKKSSVLMDGVISDRDHTLWRETMTRQGGFHIDLQMCVTNVSAFIIE